ncbi:MAG: hypothetical protein WC047_00190 [Kiritimatiellales bacterium]
MIEELTFYLWKSDTRAHWCERWEKRKTMLDDFLEKYPNAQLWVDGTPKVCAGVLYANKKPLCNGERCVDCWNKPLDMWHKEKPPVGGE